MSLKFPPVQPGSGGARNCPVRDVLDCIGGRWSLLTLVVLSGGALRFSRLRDAIGDISQRMLAQTLRTLERDGYVLRTVHPTVTPQVEYRLTALGQSLLEKVEPLILWAGENHQHVRKARNAYTPPRCIKAL